MEAPVQPAQLLDDEDRLLNELAPAGNLDDVIPQLARDRAAIKRIESHVRSLHTTHSLILGDARNASALPENSIHLVVTSPPYWTLKRYNDRAEQLGHVTDYDEFIAALDAVWRNCFRA